MCLQKMTYGLILCLYRLRVESRKLWGSAQVHHPKTTSLLHQLCADGRCQVCMRRNPLGQWGFLPWQTKLTPSKGSTMTFPETQVWAAILHGTVINVFGIILFCKHSLDIEVAAPQGWGLFTLRCNSRVLQQFLQHGNPLPLSMYYLSETQILTVLCRMMVWFWFSLGRDADHCYQGVDDTSHQPNICRNINTGNRKNRGNWINNK